MTLPEAGSCRRAANATRAHSTVDNKLVLGGGVVVVVVFDIVAVDAVRDGDRVLRDRGCSGDMGAELDRRSVVLATAGLPGTSSSSVAGRDVAGGGTDLAASPRALSVALTTWVARDAFSRVDSPDSVAVGVGVGTARPRLDGALDTAVLVLGRRAAALLPGRELGADVFSSVVVSCFGGRSRFLRRTEVAGVQVATDPTALRIVSAGAWRSIMNVVVVSCRSIFVSSCRRGCYAFVNRIIAGRVYVLVAIFCLFPPPAPGYPKKQAKRHAGRTSNRQVEFHSRMSVQSN